MNPDSVKARLVLTYWRLPNGYYRQENQLRTRKEMLAVFLERIRESNAAEVEIVSLPAQKSTLLFPQTIRKIREKAYTVESLLLY